LGHLVALQHIEKVVFYGIFTPSEGVEFCHFEPAPHKPRPVIG
jgi:hypothetical protein